MKLMKNEVQGWMMIVNGTGEQDNLTIGNMQKNAMKKWFKGNLSIYMYAKRSEKGWNKMHVLTLILKDE